MDSDSSHRDPFSRRTQLFQALSRLTPPEFGQLLYGIQPPAGLIPDAEAPQMKRVKALLDWAEGSTGRGTDEIWAALAQLQQGSLSSQGQAFPSFQPYLQSIITQYEKWWEYYTLTDVEGKVKSPKPEQPSVFDFGLMVQTVAKEKDLSDPERQSEKQEKTERLPVLEGIRKYADDHVLVVGRPGSGKSTALIRLGLEIATQTLQDGQGQIPILVELRYWETSILGLIQGFLARHGLSLDDTSLPTLLGQGQVLLLVDGLNELPSEEARTQLTAFRRNYPKVPMIFTTRDLTLGGDLGIEKKLEMQPLTEPQMKAFIRAYVPDQAETLLRQLNHRLQDFGKTPLLLWMLCEVFQQSPNQQLPNNLAEVFRIFTKGYEESAQRKHEVAALKGDVRPLSDRRLWKPALMALAARMMQGETLVDFRVAIHRTEAERELGQIFVKENFSVRDILDDLLKYHLLQNRTTDQLEFRHQLIQEYYAAEYLLRLLPELSDEQLKRDYLNLLKWTEPIALALALMSDEAQALRVVKLALDADLILGARLAGEVNQEFQAQSVKIVNTQAVKAWLKIELLGETRSENAIAFLVKMLNGSTHIMCRSIVAELGRIDSRKSLDALIQLLKHPSTRIRKDIIEILGRNTSQQAFEAIIRAWQGRDKDLSKHAENILAKALLDKNFIALNCLVKALVRPRNKRAINRSRCTYKNEAGEEFSITINPLSEASSPFSMARSSSVKAKNIIELLQDFDNLSESVRMELVRKLGEHNSDQAIPILMKALDDFSVGVRKTSVRALEKIGSDKSISVLMSALENSNIKVRQISAKALGKIGSEQAVPALIKSLNDSISINYLTIGVRNASVQALGRIGSKQAIPALIRSLDDPSYHVRQSSAQALGKIGSEQVISALVKVFNNSQPNVRQASAKALIEIGSEKAMYELIKGLIYLEISVDQATEEKI